MTARDLALLAEQAEDTIAMCERAERAEAERDELRREVKRLRLLLRLARLK
jgi:hypothetical protein